MHQRPQKVGLGQVPRSRPPRIRELTVFQPLERYPGFGGREHPELGHTHHACPGALAHSRGEQQLQQAQN